MNCETVNFVTGTSVANGRQIYFELALHFCKLSAQKIFNQRPKVLVVQKNTLISVSEK